MIEMGAEPGNLCIHIRVHNNGLTPEQLIPINSETGAIRSAGKSGTVMTTAGTQAGAFGNGAWAVTG